MSMPNPGAPNQKGWVFDVCCDIGFPIVKRIVRTWKGLLMGALWPPVAIKKKGRLHRDPSWLVLPENSSLKFRDLLVDPISWMSWILMSKNIKNFLLRLGCHRSKVSKECGTYAVPSRYAGCMIKVRIMLPCTTDNPSQCSGSSDIWTHNCHTQMAPEITRKQAQKQLECSGAWYGRHHSNLQGMRMEMGWDKMTSEYMMEYMGVSQEWGLSGRMPGER